MDCKVILKDTLYWLRKCSLFYINLYFSQSEIDNITLLSFNVICCVIFF